MNRRLATCAVVVLAAGGLGAARASSPPSPMVSVVVDLADSATDLQVQAVRSRFRLDLAPNSMMARVNRVFRTKVPGAEVDRVLANLRREPGVEAADREHVFQLSPIDARPAARSAFVLRRSFVESTRPNDPRYDEQWNFRMVNAEKAWETTRGKGVLVAVIDTGVSGVDYRKGPACRDFNTTTVAKGYDFVNDDDQPYDDHAHGTHVAGTIAESTNNGEGVAGLAHEAVILPVKVLSGSGSGTSADIADGIRYAADQGAQVINLSLGSAFPDAVIHNACKYARKKGVTIVAAAGNSGKQGVGYPAAYSECIAVSAVGPTGDLASYSSWGKQVAIAAPGGDVSGTGNPADGILQNTNLSPRLGGTGDDYYAFNGTSMASPHVAAVAALVVSRGVTDPAKVRDILCRTALPKGDAKKFGAGIVDAAKAVAASGSGGRVSMPARSGSPLPVALALVLSALGISALCTRRWAPTLLLATAVAGGALGTAAVLAPGLASTSVVGVALCWVAIAGMARWLWNGPGLRFALAVATGHVLALAASAYVEVAGPGFVPVIVAVAATLALAARVARGSR
ncbi:MAG: S8 family peptidase [Armatimonadota bacterium]